MDIARTPVSIEQIRDRVAAAFARNYLCRDLRFDVIGVPRLSKGANWTISLPAVGADALWEASEIVSDIQEVYMLSEAFVLSRAA